VVKTGLQSFIRHDGMRRLLNGLAEELSQVQQVMLSISYWHLLQENRTSHIIVSFCIESNVTIQRIKLPRGTRSISAESG
jgi:hypothetical protein